MKIMKNLFMKVAKSSILILINKINKTKVLSGKSIKDNLKNKK